MQTSSSLPWPSLSRLPRADPTHPISNAAPAPSPEQTPASPSTNTSLPHTLEDSSSVLLAFACPNIPNQHQCTSPKPHPHQCQDGPGVEHAGALVGGPGGGVRRRQRARPPRHKPPPRFNVHAHKGQQRQQVAEPDLKRGLN
jgi:hypothetical protein